MRGIHTPFFALTREQAALCQSYVELSDAFAMSTLRRANTTARYSIAAAVRSCVDSLSLHVRTPGPDFFSKPRGASILGPNLCVPLSENAAESLLFSDHIHHEQARA